MEFSRGPSLSPSSLTNELSTSFSNLDSTHCADSINSSRKRNGETKKMDEIESNFSERFATSNSQENKRESIKEKDTDLNKNVPGPSGNKVKGLINVKRNLTFLLETLDNDTNGVRTSWAISPIGQSTQIHDDDSNDDVYDNIEACGAIDDECPRNAKLQDSAECGDFHDDNTAHGNTALATNEISDDGDVETDDKHMTRLDEEVANEEKDRMQLPEQPVLDGTLMKRPQPVITSTEIVKAKYTIVRDEGETVPDAAATPLVDCLALETSQLSLGNEFLMDEEATEVNELSPESKRVGQLKRINLISNSSDSEESQDSEEDNDQVNVEKSFISPKGSTRIDESEESRAKIGNLRALPPSPSSQIISDPSDSDESIANPDETNSGKELTSRANNHRSSSSSTTSNSTARTCTAKRNEHCISDKTSLQKTVIDSVDKSIALQIREQENFQSSTVLENIEEAEEKKTKRSNLGLEVNVSSMNSQQIDDDDDDDDDSKGGDQDSDNVGTINNYVNSITNDVPHKSESLRCVLKNPVRRSDDATEREIENSIATLRDEKDGGGGRDYSRQHSDEISSRPFELREFIDREGLVATQELSTITAKDFHGCTQQNGDEEIWLMEFPRSIITDVDELCGKKLVFESGKMTINDTTYKTNCRDEKSVSCILRSGRKKARYKTVNMEPVGCLVVRQESSDKTASSASPFHTMLPLVQADAAVRQFRRTVPFPKNLKSRDPLLGLNLLNSIKDFSTANDSREIPELTETRKKKRNINESNKCRKILKKSIRKFWHIDNFTLDRKEKAT